MKVGQCFCVLKTAQKLLMLMSAMSEKLTLYGDKFTPKMGLLCGISDYTGDLFPRLRTLIKHN